MWPNPQETADLVTFTEDILNGKSSFLCSVTSAQKVRRHRIFRPWVAEKQHTEMFLVTNFVYLIFESLFSKSNENDYGMKSN